MTYLQGISVRIRTGNAKYAGTDSPVYLGVAGSDGGREFPLDVRWVDDFERLSEAKYVLGDVRDAAALAGALRPAHAEKDWNDPGLFYIGFDAIDQVYLRKFGAVSVARDDAWQLDEVEIVLYAQDGRQRRFASTTAIWLGVAYGLQVWIPEPSIAN